MKLMKLILTAIMAFSFFGLFGCRQSKAPFRTLDVRAFSAFMEQNDVVLLDVRTAAEHSAGYIPGTDFNIDVLNDDFTSTALKLLPKDKVIALYCRSGNRSKKAAVILSSNGYDVVELGSGFNGWYEAGMKLER